MGLAWSNSIRIVNLETEMLPPGIRNASINHISCVQYPLTSEHDKKIKTMLVVVRQLHAIQTTSNNN